MVVLGWIQVIDVVRVMHLLDNGPRRIIGVAVIRNERWEGPESAPIVEKAFTAVNVEVDRHPRNAYAVRVIAVGTGEGFVLDS